jgi:hypothetical protein
MSDEMEKKRLRYFGLILAIREKNGEYVLTKDQLGALLSQHRLIVDLLKRLVGRLQKVEFLLAESGLKKVGVTKGDDYLN